MSRSLASYLRPLALLAGAACAAGVATWLLRQDAQLPTAALPIPHDEEELEDSPPNSFTFEPEPESLRVSAQPAERQGVNHLLDDYGALSPEELGAAFLAGATDTAIDEPPRSTADISGFQIFDHNSGEYEADEQLSDEELVAIFARRG